MDREAQRRTFSGSIAHLLTHPDFRSAFSWPEDATRYAVIVALPDDKMQWIVDRLEQVGGAGTIVVDDVGRVALVRAEDVQKATLSPDESDIETIPVSPDTEVAMFMALMRQRTSAVRVQLAQPPENLRLRIVYDEAHDDKYAGCH